MVITIAKGIEVRKVGYVVSGRNLAGVWRVFVRGRAHGEPTTRRLAVAEARALAKESRAACHA